MKRALAASVLLLGGALMGCGSDDDGDGGSAGGDSGSGGSGTSTEEFCAAFEDFTSSLGTVDPSAPPADIIEKLKDEADKLGDVGTPEDIPDDAADGFELVLDAIDDLPDDASIEDLGTMEQDFTEDEQAKAEAFDTYLQETCPELGQGEAPESGGPSVSAPTLSPSS